MPCDKSSRRVRDPLSCIPSSAAVEARLQRVLSEAAKLNVLLKTAREIEAAQPSSALPAGNEGSVR